jgi:hypothetical protein
MIPAYSAANRTLHLWGVGAMADYMLFVSFNALLLPIYTTGFGLSPVLVGWALMLPRVFDALVDPVIGHVSDNLRTRWGRRRPFLLGAALLGAVLVMTLWWPSRDWPPALQFAHLLANSILLFVCYGAFSMTHQALGYELSDDYHVRTRVMAVRAFYFSLAALAGGWLYWLALRPVFGDEITGIRWVSAGMALVVAGAGLVPVLACRERFHHAPRTGCRCCRRCAPPCACGRSCWCCSCASRRRWGSRCTARSASTSGRTACVGATSRCSPRWPDSTASLGFAGVDRCWCRCSALPEPPARQAARPDLRVRGRVRGRGPAAVLRARRPALPACSPT